MATIGESMEREKRIKAKARTFWAGFFFGVGFNYATAVVSWPETVLTGIMFGLAAVLWRPE